MTDAVEGEDETDTTTPAPEEGTETPPTTDEADTTIPESTERVDNRNVHRDGGRDDRI